MMRFPLFPALALGGLLATGLGSAARADVVTFAQFLEVSQGTNFVLTRPNNTTATAIRLNTVNTTVGDAVNFYYIDLGNLPTALQGAQSAHLLINGGLGVQTTAPANSTAIPGVGTLLTQPINQTIVLSFTRDTPYVVTSGAGAGQSLTNLLTVTISPLAGNNVSLAGLAGSSAATASFDNTNLLLTFTSDFLDFSNVQDSDGSLSFSAVVPSLFLQGRFLRAFRADGTGTFDSDPVPTVVSAIAVVPEPASLALLLTACVAGVGMARRRA